MMVKLERLRDKVASERESTVVGAILNVLDQACDDASR